MTIRPTRSALALLLSVTFATACETGTGPGDDDAFQATLDGYEALDDALASEAWSGFLALGDRTPYGASASVAALGALDAGGAAFPRTLAARLADGPLAAAASTSGGPAGAPIISSTHRGKTFVYDAGRDEYVVAAGRTGAPANGARFVIYRTDGSGRPIVGQEIGYADLIDEGDRSAQDVALRLTVVHGDDTILDYRTTLDETVSGGTTRGALTLHGFLEGDGVRLEFDIDAAARRVGSGPEQLDVAFEIAIDERDFSIVGDLKGVQEGIDGKGDIDVTVRHRDHSIRLDAEGANGQIDATFYVNGEVFATAEGAHDHPTLRGATGEPITGLEALVLHRIMDSLEDVFDLLEDLTDPIDDLVIWGLVL